MFQKTFKALGVFTFSATMFCTVVHAGENDIEDKLRVIVNAAIEPVLEEHEIPGMAVAITVNGNRHFYNYGVASRQSGQRVSQDTLFEIGSVSKTFTATLAAYGQTLGTLSLDDSAGKYWPALRGSVLGKTSLLALGTYTAGGLPLQFPDGVTDQETMAAYYEKWQPAHEAGTRRLYSNPSIGLFGYLAARSMKKPYPELFETILRPKLGLTNSYIRVPEEKMEQYAWGYTTEGMPIRVKPGPLDGEAYGVKSSTADMIRFVEVNINGSVLEKEMRQAIVTAQTGYVKTGGMIQALGWEKYSHPVALETLIENSSPEVVLNANKAIRLVPPLAPQGNVFINKTGSTNGFGAYVAFVPEKGIGIVMLANKNFPNPARIKAAYRILTALENNKKAGNNGNTGNTGNTSRRR